MDIYLHGVSDNPGAGVWAAGFVTSDSERTTMTSIQGSETQSTRFSLEIVGAINALATLSPNTQVTVHCKPYLHKAMTKLIPSRGHVGYANEDLFGKLLPLVDALDVTWEHIDEQNPLDRRIVNALDEFIRNEYASITNKQRPVKSESAFITNLREGKWLSNGAAIPFEHMEDGHLYAILHNKNKYIRNTLYYENDLRDVQNEIARDILNTLPEDFRRVVTVDIDRLETYVKQHYISKDMVRACMELDEAVQAIRPELDQRGIWNNFWGLQDE